MTSILISFPPRTAWALGRECSRHILLSAIGQAALPERLSYSTVENLNLDQRALLSFGARKRVKYDFLLSEAWRVAALSNEVLTIMGA